MGLRLLTLFLVISVPAFAPPEPKYVKLKKTTMVTVQGDQPAQVSVLFTVDKGMHVQANPATLPNLIATTLTFEPHADLEVGQVVYPTPKMHRVQSMGEIATYEGTAAITVPVKKTLTATPKKTTLNGKLRYQACSEITCFFPMTLPVKVPITLK